MSWFEDDNLRKNSRKPSKYCPNLWSNHWTSPPEHLKVQEVLIFMSPQMLVGLGSYCSTVCLLGSMMDGSFMVLSTAWTSKEILYYKMQWSTVASEAPHLLLWSNGLLASFLYLHHAENLAISTMKPLKNNYHNYHLRNKGKLYQTLA